MLFKKKSFLKSLAFTVLFSVAIETAQFLIGLKIGYRYRSVDIDDVILNMMGGIIGCGLYRITPVKVRKQFGGKD